MLAAGPLAQGEGGTSRPRRGVPKSRAGSAATDLDVAVEPEVGPARPVCEPQGHLPSAVAVAGGRAGLCQAEGSRPRGALQLQLQHRRLPIPSTSLARLASPCPHRERLHGPLAGPTRIVRMPRERRAGRHGPARVQGEHLQPNLPRPAAASRHGASRYGASRHGTSRHGASRHGVMRPRPCTASPPSRRSAANAASNLVHAHGLHAHVQPRASAGQA